VITVRPPALLFGIPIADLTMQEALDDPHFKARGLFSRKVTADGKTVIALPVPVADVFRSGAVEAGYPALGDANGILK